MDCALWQWTSSKNLVSLCCFCLHLACLYHTHTPHPGIKSADTFTRWRTHYLTHGSFRPDRRGRFTSGFLLRHDDLKLALTRYLLSKVKRDINISEVRCLSVCLPVHPHPHPHSPPLITDTRFYKRNFAWVISYRKDRQMLWFAPPNFLRNCSPMDVNLRMLV